LALAKILSGIFTFLRLRQKKKYFSPKIFVTFFFSFPWQQSRRTLFAGVQPSLGVYHPERGRDHHVSAVEALHCEVIDAILFHLAGSHHPNVSLCIRQPSVLQSLA